MPGGPSAIDALKSILDDQKLKATGAFGQAVAKLTAAGIATTSQNCVCFTETPFLHLHLLTGAIKGRNVNLRPYGIAITRKYGRRKKANPIWYLDTTPAEPGTFRTWLTKNVDNLIAAAVSNNAAVPFANSDIAKLAPFIEQMGRWTNGKKKEFWWEREWRCNGDLALPNRVLVLAPEGDHAALLAHATANYTHVALIDPSWSLEQTIGRLAGMPAQDLGL